MYFLDLWILHHFSKCFPLSLIISHLTRLDLSFSGNIPIFFISRIAPNQFQRIFCHDNISDSPINSISRADLVVARSNSQSSFNSLSLLSSHLPACNSSWRRRRITVTPPSFLVVGVGLKGLRVGRNDPLLAPRLSSSTSKTWHDSRFSPLQSSSVFSYSRCPTVARPRYHSHSASRINRIHF